MNQGTFPSQEWRLVERTVDERSLLFPGDVDNNGRPLPMTVEILAARAKRWPQSAETPANISGLLARSRELFVDGYYTYENFLDAAVRSLQAVEAALRIRLRASPKTPFAKLIEQAHAQGIVTTNAREVLHAGRQLRNDQVHATAVQVWTPALAAEIICTSHQLLILRCSLRTTEDEQLWDHPSSSASGTAARMSASLKLADRIASMPDHHL